MSSLTAGVTGMVLGLFALTCSASPALGAPPSGPRLAIVTHDACCGAELVTVGPAGDAARELIAQPASDRPSWSADGSLLAFGAMKDGSRMVAVASADGGGLRVYPRASPDGGDPVIAPDGRSVAFTRTRLVKILPGRESYLFKSAIWSLGVADGSVRRLTRWRLAAWIEPTSFSPDGSSLAAELVDRRGRRAVAIDLGDKRTTPLAREAQEPTYSPDGTRLAFVRERTKLFDLPKPNRPVSELWVSSAAGSDARRLLRRRGFISWPGWDPSGSRLSFTYDPPDLTGSREPEPGNEVMALNADGTCLTTVFSRPELTLFGAAWQPGPGREAGPISC